MGTTHCCPLEQFWPTFYSKWRFFTFRCAFTAPLPFVQPHKQEGHFTRWTADPASAKRQKSGDGIKSWKNSCCHLFLITFILRLTCLAWKQNGFIVHIVCRYEFSRRSTAISFPVVRSLRTRPIRSPSVAPRLRSGLECRSSYDMNGFW